MSPADRNDPPARILRRCLHRRRTTGLALLLCLAPGFGCGREFYRNWADQDVTEAVFEKSRDPRWRIDMFTVEPPALARFADPYDPDRPPAPPDDPAAEALSPMPQRPVFQLLTPQEGTGYLDMLEAWKRNQPAPRPARVPTPVAEPITEPPAPPEAAGSPFRNQTNSGPATGPMSPIPDGARAPAVVPGPRSPVATPPGSEPRPSAATSPEVGVVPLRARSRPKDLGVQLTAFQAPDAVQPLPPVGEGPGLDLEPAESPLSPAPVPTDPDPTSPDVSRPVTGSGLPPEIDREAAARTTRLSPLLQTNAATFDEAEAAGLPIGSDPYVLTPPQALALALVNSRAYQFRVENVYLQSIPVTAARFAFEPQFVAGLSPTTAPAGVFPSPNPVNSFLYRTREAPGGQQSVMSIGTLAGFGKLFMSGARVAGGFANQLTFNFIGPTPRQPIVQSFLPLSITQPFLRGGGRAVVLEPLTQAERNLLYEVRNLARFRQQFVPFILTSNQPANQLGTSDPAPGFLNILQLVQQVENARKTVAAFELQLKGFREMAEGGGSGVSQLNVDTINVSLQNARQTLLNAGINYQNFLDQFKMQLGMPPDVELVLDRGVTSGFRQVFDEIDVWFAQEDRVPEELPVILSRLPNLEDAVIDGRSVLGILAQEREVIAKDNQIASVQSDLDKIPKLVLDIIDEEDSLRTIPPDEVENRAARQRIIQQRRRELDDLIARKPGMEQELVRLKAELVQLRKRLSGLQNDTLLAAERVALEHRYELMNARGALYDAWRQLTVTANALRGVFTVSASNQFLLPPNTTNPFAFVDQAKNFSLQFNTELPLVRLAERNAFRNAQILYRQAQRQLQFQEDQIKLVIRQNIRSLRQSANSYQIQKDSLVVSLRQKDNSQRLIFAPPGPGDTGGSQQVTANTQQLVLAQNSVLNAQNLLINIWVTYQASRLALYRDLGIIPYDEWEAYYELFPSEPGGRGPGRAPERGVRDPAAGAAGPAPVGP